VDRSQDVRLHHVGIVVRAPLTGRLDEVAGGEAPAENVAYAFVPEYDCHCWLDGQIEYVAPADPDGDSALARWLREHNGPSLHHIAFEVPDVDRHADLLSARGLPVIGQAAVEGVAGLRVRFVHPSHLGILVELVETSVAR
jgi:methylmalonyl-CoA/ethylmalonyl-CoA epimerase